MQITAATTGRRACVRVVQAKTKKISIRERSIHVGDFVVVNGYRVNRDLLKERFAEGGYQAHETPHFLLFTCS